MRWRKPSGEPERMKTPAEMMRDALVQHIMEGPHAKTPDELVADLMKRSGGRADPRQCHELALALFYEGEK